MYISSSLTILQCTDNVNNYEDGISGRPGSFTAVKYQTLAFIQVLEKQRLWEKSVTRLEKAGDGIIQNSLTYLLLHLPLPLPPAQREMHQEKVITGDYPMYERETKSAVSLPKLNNFL